MKGKSGNCIPQFVFEISFSSVIHRDSNSGCEVIFYRATRMHSADYLSFFTIDSPTTVVYPHKWDCNILMGTH